MSAPDIDNKVIDLFNALAGDAHLTIVLGAGASAPSGLPQWDVFAARLAVLSGLVADETAAHVLLSKQDPTIVLEAAHSLAGEQWPEDLHTALFGAGAADPEPSPLHLAAAGHYFELPDSTTLATLNFDTLLESAVLTTGASTVTIDTEGDDGEAEPTVHHLHGAVFDGQAYAPVVGYSDYAELVADETAWQRNFLAVALRRGPLLLAGTSYRDPDIRHWLHLIMREGPIPHPALVTIVREGLGLDRETFETIDDALVAEWESIGLTAVTMHDLSDVALVIRELQFVGISGYQSPSERSRIVWDEHAGNFDALQMTYAHALAEDATALAATLDVAAHRATLWLADARGNLARWASEDSIFTGVDRLKRVPTGHDSPWIAGEAIASETVKLKDVDREQRVRPTWRSVLAIPIFVGDGHLPGIASAVLTFGLGDSAENLLARQDEWSAVTEALSAAWETRLNHVAFPSDPGILD